MFRKGAQVFLASLKPIDPVVASASVAVPIGESALPVQPGPPVDPISSEKKWINDLFVEFSGVFQDPLPVGLPPERSEGRSIPTEPGHPPTVRQMYRLSPLEYRELEKQVTAFLKEVHRCLS